MQRIFLPGTSEQLNLLIDKVDLDGKSIVVFGSNSEQIAKILSERSNTKVELIVEDYESLINSELILEGAGNVAVKMMAFDSTDYQDQSFDIVYAQASISSKMRNKIIKEIKRILKPEGYFCVGEIVQLSESVATFVINAWEDSALLPLHTDKIRSYYEERNFKVVSEEELNKTLTSFYSMAAGSLKDQLNKLTEQEKSAYKKLLKKISHESNVYLKQGGNRHMGFKVLLMQK
jgi:SAM-dependent methyltransferase